MTTLYRYEIGDPVSHSVVEWEPSKAAALWRAQRLADRYRHRMVVFDRMARVGAVDRWIIDPGDGDQLLAIPDTRKGESRTRCPDCNGKRIEPAPHLATETREALDAPSVTVADVMRWRPCYSRDRIKELFAGRTRLTALDILDLDVPVADRFWAVLRETFLPREQIVSLACDFAERVLPLFEARYPDDKRPREAIEAARSGDKQRAREARKAATAAATAAAYAAANAANAARKTEQDWQLARVRQVIEKSSR